MDNIGFIGCGNMGGALIRAAVKSVKPAQIWITDKDTAKCAALAKETGAAAKDINEIASKCQYIFLGVKPQVLAEMVSVIKDILLSRKNKSSLTSPI